MTSPLLSPQHFHPRATLAPDLPPARHLVFRCARCGHLAIRFTQHCTCHPSALMHGHEVSLDEYTRLQTAGADRVVSAANFTR